MIILMMEICEALPPRLKALNRDNITDVMHFEMENVVSDLTKS